MYDSLVKSVDFEYCHDIAFKDVGYCLQHNELEARLKDFFERAGNSVTDKGLWTWVGSFFFVFHLSSTVGYATQGAPATPGGQLGAVAFGLLGVPLFTSALLLASAPLASAASSLVAGAARRSSGTSAGAAAAAAGTGGGEAPPAPPPPRWPLASTLATIVPLAAVALALLGLLWLGAAWLFAVVEGWSYARALFFCFMTITTVGIGDDVPGTLLGRVLTITYIYASLSVSLGIVRAASRCFDGGHESALVALVRGDSDIDERSARGRLGFAWLCFAVVLGLCFCAGAIFPLLERDAELERYQRSRTMFHDLSALAKFRGCDTEMIGMMDFCRNVRWFRTSLHTFFGPETPNSMVDRHHWTGAGSAAFALSVASTIGYGTQSPHTHEGKVAAVVLGAFAIPTFICGALFCAAPLRRAARRCMRDLAAAGGALGSRHEDGEGVVAAAAASAAAGARAPGAAAAGAAAGAGAPARELAALVLALWIGGAAIFCLLEGWSFSRALYFCFVTLSAIGFANVTPRTALGRIAMLVYIAVGLTSAGALAGEVAARMLAALGVDPEEEMSEAEKQDEDAIGSGSRDYGATSAAAA